MTKHWREADGEIERSALWVAHKTGPYKDQHRAECQCEGCCGKQLAEEIRLFYRSRESS